MEPQEEHNEAEKGKRNMEKLFDLQVFAQENTQTTGGLSAEMKTYYGMELLDNAKPQLGALLLQRLPVGLHLLAQLPQVVDDALVVLGHLVDEVDAAQKIAEAGGLEDHRPEGGGTPLLLIPHLTAEQVVLGLLLLLVVRQLRLQRIDLLLGVGDLAAEDVRLLIRLQKSRTVIFLMATPF